MCDLIDLKSPDGKSSAGTKLASPLIPAPTIATADSTVATVIEGVANALDSNSACTNIANRNSLDNNPFDNAHHKIIEYTRKLDDPFESALEKALTYNETRGKNSKFRNVEFNDDFTPKKRRYSDILKMNKTLDDSLIDPGLDAIEEIASSKLLAKVEEREIRNCEKVASVKKSPTKNLSSNPTIPRLCLESGLETSILNNSAMNDSLTESSGSSDDCLAKSLLVRKISERLVAATRDTNFLCVDDTIPGTIKLRRSLSQGDRGSPRKFRQHRSRSIVDCPIAGTIDIDKSDVSCLPSIVFDDSMNKAFLTTFTSDNPSIVSNVSNLSSIARLNSVSSGCNSSNSPSAYSDRTANRAFIENSVRDVPRCSDGSVSSIFRSPMEVTRDEKALDDLIFKYSKLRTKSSVSPIGEDPSLSRKKSTIRRSGIPIDETVVSKHVDKLIDIDVFVPVAKDSPTSSTSSDSVFIDSGTMGKSILSEAKNLAKTFAELAEKTSSTSSSLGDDLLNGRINWNFDMLPPSDDEGQVDDLIELEKSPNCNGEIENTPEESEKSGSSSNEKSEKSMLRELETEFVEPEKKIIATTLLLDLEKIVKSDENPKAAELLKSLENALGIRSNADLLATCFTVRNDLAKSPKRAENALGNENIGMNVNEKSREDNSEIETMENFGKLSIDDEKLLRDNLNVSKDINKSDKLIVTNDRDVDLSNVKITNDDDVKCSRDDSFPDKDRLTKDQKMAVEILVGLGKLLTGDDHDPMTSNLLKNLSAALNLASSNQNYSSTKISSSPGKKRLSSAKNRVATPPRKNFVNSNFARTANRRSLESASKSKNSADRVMRRSISVTQTPTSTTPNIIPRLTNNPLSADKTKAHLKDARKRFSSDPTAEIHAINARKSIKDTTVKAVGSTEIVRQEKPSSTVIIGNVKNKLRKKVDPDVVSKKGPMKAMIPLGNMQRRGSVTKKVSPLNGSLTPPKSGRETPSAFTVTTSTPFPIVHLSIPKKTTKSKPIASSTPDDVTTRNQRRSTPQIPPSPGKNSLSCNISPVTSKNDDANDDNPTLNNSKSMKTSKIGTPAKSRSGSQLPKLSPMTLTRGSPIKSSRGQRRSESLQSFLPRSVNTPKSPRERHGSDGSVSPLNNSNKIASKVKPFNLISKLRGRSASVSEKENYA